MGAVALSSGKGVRYGAFGGGGVTTMVVEVLLGVGGFDVDRGVNKGGNGLDFGHFGQKSLFHFIELILIYIQ